MNSSDTRQPDVSFPVHDLIANRWSPYRFEPRAIEPDKLGGCLEAARWAASSYNEQPWVFIVAERTDDAEFARLLSCLVEFNQSWAKNAGALILTVAAGTFSRNGKPNRMAEHDVGLAIGNLTLQATASGLAVHQMAGVDLEKARAEFQIPTTHDPLTAVAIGYVATDDADPSDGLAQRDNGPRQRKPLDEIVKRGPWDA